MYLMLVQNLRLAFSCVVTDDQHGKLNNSHAMLFVCDVQERFRGVISHMPYVHISHICSYVIDTARRLVGSLRWNVHEAACRTQPVRLLLCQVAREYPHELHLQVRGAQALQVSVVVTEQYAQALGHTVMELRGALPCRYQFLSQYFAYEVPEPSSRFKQTCFWHCRS